MTVLVLDNFLEYPTVVREWAIKHRFYSSEEFTEMQGKRSDWPGKRTQHVVDLDSMYANVILTRIANIANKHYGLTNVSIRSYFQLTTEHDGDSWVHQDNNVLLAAILYLNPNPPKNSGTILYNCKDVNEWNSYMNTQQGYQTLKTINTVQNKELYEKLFEPVDLIGNVFNRLLFYPGDTYHKSNQYFGDTVEDGRLTQVFFITQE